MLIFPAFRLGEAYGKIVTRPPPQHPVIDSVEIGDDFC
jgi:hypothetical protein